MGGPKNWFKTLVGLKKSAKKNEPKQQSKHFIEKDEVCVYLESTQNQSISSSVPSTNSESNFDPVPASVVVQHPTRVCDRFQGPSREESAAVCIQTAFRGLLARKALRALKGLVRLQALVRGQAVRKQAAMTLRCMQALVRLQARVQARRTCMAMESYLTQQNRDHQARLDNQEGWCDRLGSMEEIQKKMRKKQEAAAKRERAMSYAFSNQWRASSRTSHEQLIPDKTNLGWNWLERWMVAHPWESQVLHDQGRMDGLESICSNSLEQSFDLTPTHSHSRSHSFSNAKESPNTDDPRSKRRLSLPSPEKRTSFQKSQNPQQKINQRMEGKKTLKKSDQQCTRAGQLKPLPRTVKRIGAV